MANTTIELTEQQHFLLSGLSPSRTQRRLAFGVVLALLVSFAVVAGPLSSIQLAAIESVVLALLIPLVVTESITAILLYAQFSIVGSAALVTLATGYLVTACILLAYILTLPGLFSPGGLLTAGQQTGFWLATLRHAAFPSFLIAYSWLKDAKASKPVPEHLRGAVTAATVAAAATSIAAATCLLIAADPLLPRVMIDSAHASMFWRYDAWSLALLCIVALVVLWLKWHSVLDLWLMVVMCAYASGNILVASGIPARYSVEWYAARGFELVAGSLVLFVLLYEIVTLYAQLLRALAAHRREREARMITGDAVAATIAHEIKQPLTAMVTNADAGVRFLNRVPPDLEEAKAVFKAIAANGHQAGEIIGSIRSIFKTQLQKRTSFNVNELIGEALAAVYDDLRQHRIFVRYEPNEQLSQVSGDRIQLHRVLVNLVTNAIEAMAGIDGPRILSVKSEACDGSGVAVSVADTGPGIQSQDIGRIFDPLFTTKSDGMGMGLSICRSIIQFHDAELSVAPNTPTGAVFRFVLRAEARHPSERASAVGPRA
jgi:signal transduction histidine kinase